MNLQDRVILHCDANNFFASVESVTKPELKGKPVAVSGNPLERTGIILAKNEIAKKFGVSTGEPIWQAKQKCPNLVCLPPHHDLYEEYSQKLYKIYATYTDKIEPFGIDECWLDVTGSMRIFGSVDNIAEQIRQRVKDELKITVSIGISFCKIFAKFGSDLKKPDAITKITRENFKKILYPMPITTVIGIGRRLEETLHKINVYTVQDYVALPSELIKKKFGKVGIELKEKLEGFDTSEVEKDFPVPKSVGNGTTTIVDIHTKEEVLATISFLAEKVAKRLREKHLLALGVGIFVKTSEFETWAKEKRIDSPTSSGTKIATEAFDLLCEFWNFSNLIRSVRVRTFDLVSENELTQTSLFYDEKKQELGCGLDQIWSKYGPDAITLASNIKSNFFLRR